MKKRTHFGVDHIPDAGAQQIHQFLLDDGQLSEESIFVTRQDGIGQTSQTERPG